MKQIPWLGAAAAGGAAGLVCGFFGGGGGMVLVPLLIRLSGLERRHAFASSVAVILPLCLVSVAVYCLRGRLDLTAALPFLLGGLAGGFLGGRVFGRVPVDWLRRGFALLIVYGGIRALI